MAVNASTKTIVIIDDEDSIIALFYHMLAREGFKVVPFKSATEAISKLTIKKYKIDLLILDLMMPGIGGYDMVKKLQETEFYRTTPIFIASARKLDQDTIELIRSEQNVKEFFSKPIDPKTFTPRVHKLLNTQKSASANGEEY